MRRASRKQARASLFMSAMDTYGQSLELNSQCPKIQRTVDSNWLLIAQSLSAPAPKRLFKFPDLNLQNNFLPLHRHYVWASRIAIDFKTSIFCFLHHIHLVIPSGGGQISKSQQTFGILWPIVARHCEFSRGSNICAAENAFWRRAAAWTTRSTGRTLLEPQPSHSYSENSSSSEK